MYINDPVHGMIELDEIQKAIVSLPEIQRLIWIKQLGVTFLCYPGAVHTRLSHAVGVSHVAKMIAEHLKLDKKRKNLLVSAGLLHDIGHTPFSHTLESLLPKDHMDYTRNLIIGTEVMNIPDAGQISKILEKYDIDPVEVGDLINGKHKDPLLQQAIFGNIDADQLDYLGRDAYFCGISHGVIDLYRIIYTMRENDGQLVFLEKSIDALEEMLVARNHMFSAVYAHKTDRIAEMMLLKAMKISLDLFPEFHTMVDGELLCKLRGAKSGSKDLVERLLFRHLYKTAFSVESLGDEGLKSSLIEVCKENSKKDIELKLLEITGLKEGDLLVDTPVNVLKLSEPRLKRMNINILRKNGEISSLLDLSKIAQVLTQKESSYILFAVYCENDNMKKVEKACKQLFKVS